MTTQQQTTTTTTTETHHAVTALEIATLRQHGIDTGDAVSAELARARDDVPGYRHEARGTLCPVCGETGGYLLGVLLLRTAEGRTYGTGAHAGSIVGVHLDCAPEWRESVELYRLGADTTEEPCCADCASAAGPLRDEDGNDVDPIPAGTGECWSCTEMRRESETDAARDQEIDEAIAQRDGHEAE